MEFKKTFWIILIFFNCVFVGNVHAMLIGECSDKEYLSNQASYIIEGTVKTVENIGDHYYNDITVEKYVKGNSITGDKILIVTAGRPGMWVEDEPGFSVGERVKLYLVKTDAGFSIVCGAAGVETIGDEPTQKTFVDPSASIFVSIVVVFAIILIVLVFFMYKQRKRNTKRK
jgi:multisubunit Na+/H+ antiporter MnhC subunit